VLDVDVSVVTYRPDFDLLERLAASIAEQAGGLGVHLRIADNSPDRETTARIAALPSLQPGGAFAQVDVQRTGANVGFGRGHNANAARGTAPFVLVLNQDCILEPGVLGGLLALAAADEARVAAWEMR
jgi:GT2 family glycosyltransferase